MKHNSKLGNDLTSKTTSTPNEIHTTQIDMNLQTTSLQKTDNLIVSSERIKPSTTLNSNENLLNTTHISYKQFSETPNNYIAKRQSENLTIMENLFREFTTANYTTVTRSSIDIDSSESQFVTVIFAHKLP